MSLISHRQEAVQWLQGVARTLRRPEPRRGHSIVGLVKKGQDELESARQAVHARKPGLATVHLHTAKTCLSRASESAAQHSIQLDPEVLEDLAETFDRLHVEPEAIRLTSQDFWRAYADRSLYAGKLNQARCAYGRLLNGGLRDTDVEARLGNIYRQQRCWTAVLTEAPQAAEGFLLQQANNAYNFAEREQAARIFQHVQNQRHTQGSVPAVQALLGRAANGQEQRDALQTLLDLQPDDFATCCDACLQACELDPELARRFYSRAEAVAQQNGQQADLEQLSQDVLRRMTEQMRNSKRPPDATLLQALKTADGQALFAAGDAAFNLGDAGIACQLFARATALGEPTAAGCRRIAQAYEQAGDMPHAHLWRERATTQPQ